MKKAIAPFLRLADDTKPTPELLSKIAAAINVAPADKTVSEKFDLDFNASKHIWFSDDITRIPFTLVAPVFLAFFDYVNESEYGY